MHKNKLHKKQSAEQTATTMGHWGVSRRHGADGTRLMEKDQRALVQPGKGKHAALHGRALDHSVRSGASEGSGTLAWQACPPHIHWPGNSTRMSAGPPLPRADRQRSEIPHRSVHRGLAQGQQEQTWGTWTQEPSSDLSGPALPCLTRV